MTCHMPDTAPHKHGVDQIVHLDTIESARSCELIYLVRIGRCPPESHTAKYHPDRLARGTGD